MESTVEQLIAERSYSSLNQSEKALVSELCANEQEFNQMKQFFVGMNDIAASSQFEPSAGLKSSLDSVFAAKHGGIGARLTPREVAPTPVAAKIIPFYQQTWARVAAGVLLIAGAVSIWQLSGNTAFVTEKKQQMAKAETNEQIMEAASPDSESVSLETKAGSNSLVKSNRQVLEAEKDESYPVNEDILAKAEFETPVLYDSKFSAAETDQNSYAFSKVQNGREADLYPDGNKDAKSRSTLNASAVSNSQEDLLSYIVPAF